MTLRPTKPGLLFVGILVLFYFASLTSQSGLLLLLVGIFLGCYLVNAVAAWRALKHLEIQTPATVHIGEGQRLSQPWRVRNRSSQPAGLLQLESADGALFRLTSLAARSEAKVVPDLVYWRRGVHPYGRLTVTSSYPFGLIKAMRSLEVAGQVVVFPALYHVPAPRAGGYDAMVGGKFKGSRRSGSGSHFAGVRPIQPGDSLKQIHWKSSAKGRGLMVKTFDEELSGRVALIMDAGNSGDDKALDDCVRATGSLMFAALDSGDHIEWIGLDNLELRLIPPFTDGHELLDALARIEAAPGCLDSERLRRAIDSVSTRSAICLVLTEFNDAVSRTIARLRQQGRQTSIYLPEPCRASLNEALAGAAIFYYSASSIEPREGPSMPRIGERRGQTIS
jgi:uncharacterized protein (DUF58 family)